VALLDSPEEQGTAFMLLCNGWRPFLRCCRFSGGDVENDARGGETEFDSDEELLGKEEEEVEVDKEGGGDREREACLDMAGGKDCCDRDRVGCPVEIDL